MSFIWTENGGYRLATGEVDTYGAHRLCSEQLALRIATLDELPPTSPVQALRLVDEAIATYEEARGLLERVELQQQDTAFILWLILIATAANVVLLSVLMALGGTAGLVAGLIAAAGFAGIARQLARLARAWRAGQ